MTLKLLIHVNEPERWLIAISNITNFLNDVGDKNAAVMVVANGAGVKGYLKKEAEKTDVQGEACAIGAAANITAMAELAKRGVAFLACNNALKAQKIVLDELPDFVQVIPAGMTEMVRMQTEGFAYIKP
jgi:hypothetical protein